MSSPPAVKAPGKAPDKDDAYLAYVQKIVDAAPPLTPEQRTRLALLLRGGGAA